MVSSRHLRSQSLKDKINVKIEACTGFYFFVRCFLEQTYSKREFLLNLLKAAKDPFCSDEKLNDIRKVLMDSKNFSGTNHLILLKDYFSDDRVFYLEKKDALLQADRAIEEGNIIGYYYLYLLYLKEDSKKAVQCLKKVINKSYPLADLAYAKHLLAGDIVDKDEDEAFKYYQIGSRFNLAEGYYGMILILQRRGDFMEAKKVYDQATENGISLPGVVR